MPALRQTISTLWRLSQKYGGVIFSMLTAVIYSIKGGVAIKQALAHPEDEDIDFLNPEIED